MMRRENLRALVKSIALLGVCAAALALPIGAQTGEAQQTLDLPVLPPPPTASGVREIRVPIGRQPAADTLRMSAEGDRITLVARDAPLSDVLALLAEERKLNIVFSDNMVERVSITLQDARLEDTLSSILTVAGYRWVRSRGIILVTKVDQTNLPAHVQGRQMRVFSLDYSAASDMLETVQGFLSPVGKAYIQVSSPVDNRRTKEAIVVEDLPDVLARVEAYVAQIDQPPRQVLIQVHVLLVELKDDYKHGVNLDAILEIAHTPIQLETVGFANANANTATFLSLQGTDLSALVELLQTTTDAKTIASPRVLCLNGQESRIQVGEQLGYRVTTTTETSTLESVEFLDLGVVLRVTPRISRDDRVMMQIKPQLSSGRVNPLTGLPEEETTEVETNALLRNGQAIVIGGLIQELDNDTQSKVPKLGDAWRVGKLFQKREWNKERSEVIIALVPYILPYHECNAMRDAEAVTRAATPLLHGPLLEVDRPWEARLPSANERPVRLPAVDDSCCGSETPRVLLPPGQCVVPQYPTPVVEELPPGEILRDRDRVSPPPSAVQGRRLGARISRFFNSGSSR